VADIPNTGPVDPILRFLETDNGQRIAIVAFSLVAAAVLWTLSGTAFAYIFGIPLLFFVPGFAVVRLFFWKGTSPEAKFVLSLGLSILVIIFLGLILVLTFIGLSMDSAIASVLLFCLGAVAVDFVWLGREPKGAKKPSEPEPERAPLGTAIAISVISLGLILTADYPSRTYFAVTDSSGSADINTTRDINSTLNLVLHAKNGEDGQRTFRIVAHNETISYSETFTRILEKGEIWEQNVSIDLVYYGQFNIDFDLYIQKQGSPEYFYGNLHLWIAVV
jgi:uncharacterized membrane protein